MSLDFTEPKRFREPRFWNVTERRSSHPARDRSFSGASLRAVGTHSNWYRNVSFGPMKTCERDSPSLKERSLEGNLHVKIYHTYAIKLSITYG